ncbi:HKD family nuclease [Flavobacterium sp. 270]|uniref:phospholipase D-like domain-containing protein n=1 Tax=Flavobacterium sp. 270 TaxID=2512114 RepID=UPI00106499F3|nr:phospholipase D-like domain-containing protein [Flavobacterium sp. 270]TDW51820.1 HKD family nuclease [Flavobacterium sp. 270]
MEVELSLVENTMIISDLKLNFDKLLKTTEEIWFSVALVKESTYDYIQETINKNCKQNYLIGIDLPTHPQVLRKMHEKLEKDLFESAIYKTKYNFHPKVYLFKKNDNYTAFIGSSNLTDGGLEDNIELNYKITNKEDCLSILNWFNTLYKESFPLTEDNILAYEEQFYSISELEKELKKKKKGLKLKRPVSANNPLEQINFSDRYFKKEHHWAFRSELWFNDTKEAIFERELAKNRCITLHNSIFPSFKDYGIQILQPNPMADHLISMTRQIDPTKPRKINAMWLSYGKSNNEIKEYQKLVGQDQKAKQTFIHHSRIQLKIDLNNIGIYLLFAKENEGGIFDRHFFKTSMRNKVYRDKFHEMINSLPDQYFISVGGNDEFCNKFNSPEELHEFCKNDDIQKYFIIGRDFQITDDRMSENNLPQETLKIFKLLFPLYEMMRHKF